MDLRELAACLAKLDKLRPRAAAPAGVLMPAVQALQARLAKLVEDNFQEADGFETGEVASGAVRGGEGVGRGSGDGRVLAEAVAAPTNSGHHLMSAS